MGGLTRLPVEGEDILIFSNIISDGVRKNGHVWASFDGGKTWPIKRRVEKGRFAYSSLTSGRPGTPSEGWIYLLYEGDGGEMTRFNLIVITREPRPPEQTGTPITTCRRSSSFFQDHSNHNHKRAPGRAGLPERNNLL